MGKVTKKKVTKEKRAYRTVEDPNEKLVRKIGGSLMLNITREAGVMGLKDGDCLYVDSLDMKGVSLKVRDER